MHMENFFQVPSSVLYSETRASSILKLLNMYEESMKSLQVSRVMELVY